MLKTYCSYFGCRYLDHYVKLVLPELKPYFTGIILPYSEYDKQWYKENTSKIIKATIDSGMECWVDPWGIGGATFGGEQTSELAINYPGRFKSYRYKQYAVCLQSKEFISYIKSWIDDVASFGATGIFWDEPKHVCNCYKCRKSPKTKVVLNFLEFVTNYTKEKGLKNIICMLPYSAVGNLWEKIINLKGLDVFAVDPYFTIHGVSILPKLYVSSIIKKIKKVCPEKEWQIWFQGFRLKEKNIKDIVNAMDMSYKLGCHNMSIWSFHGTEVMAPSMSCENPEHYWNSIINKIKELKENEKTN